LAYDFSSFDFFGFWEFSFFKSRPSFASFDGIEIFASIQDFDLERDVRMSTIRLSTSKAGIFKSPFTSGCQSLEFQSLNQLSNQFLLLFSSSSFHRSLRNSSLIFLSLIQYQRLL
jgi:hypothetical protein